MLQYQINHGPDGWQTQNSVMPGVADSIRALMTGRGRAEGKTWRIFDPSAVVETQEAVEAVEAVKPPRAPRAPRKAVKAAQGTTEGGKSAAVKSTRTPRKKVTSAVEGAEKK